MSKEPFMDKDQHFERLVQSLPGEALQLYRQTKHVRIEEAFRGRTFYLYQMDGDRPKVLEHLTVTDFECNDRVGASTVLRSEKGRKLNVMDYRPQQVWDYPVFVFIPLPTRIRWSTTANRLHTGSLSFPLCIRVMTRLSPREPGVVHMETGVEFAREFEAAAQH